MRDDNVYNTQYSTEQVSVKITQITPCRRAIVLAAEHREGEGSGYVSNQFAEPTRWYQKSEIGNQGMNKPETTRRQSTE